MSDSTREQAVAIAGRVYEALMAEVVEGPVLADRIGQLGEAQRRRTAAGTAIDHRWVRLMTISGKGGWHPDPAIRKRYAASANMTALDHFLSVSRGALIFAAMESAADAADDLDMESLEARLRVVAAVAFVHDMDKDLGLSRGQSLSLTTVAERWHYYGLHKFIAPAYTLGPDQVRCLIEHVEASQAHRHPPEQPVPRELMSLARYISLADKLDGLWLSEGVDGVLQRLATDEVLCSDLLRQWRVIDLFDPHHPFLLDEFQRMLSVCCVRVAKIPPLFEIHQDGRLVVLVPATHGDDIIDCALDGLIHALERRAFGLRVNISNRGVPELLNLRPDWALLSSYCQRMESHVLGQLFRVKRNLRSQITTELSALLRPLGLSARWPDSSKQTLTPYPDPDQLSAAAQMRLRRAALLVILINHQAGKGAPDYSTREQQLIEALETPPPWLQSVEDGASRRTLLALWATALAHRSTEVSHTVWGDRGLLQGWLEGKNETPGIDQSVADRGGQTLRAVREHFRSRLAGECVPDDPAIGSGRCLFTAAAVGKEWVIKQADGLYGIKVSAFSGRDGRREHIGDDRAETFVGPVSRAEHRWRQIIHDQSGGKPAGVSTFISSPITTGLFAALTLNDEADLNTASVYDLSRRKVEKGKPIYRGLEVYRSRYRLARYEAMPTKTADQVNLLRMLITTALRSGRPLHLFRGLPTPQKAFFFFDAMPQRLADLIGGASLRLEQLMPALEKLQRAQFLLEANGLGYETFNRYANPATRLEAVCLAWTHLRSDRR